MRLPTLLIGSSLLMTAACAADQANAPAVAAAGSGAAAATSQAVPAAEAPAPAGQTTAAKPTDVSLEQGKALFESACSSCHDLSLATQKRMSTAKWRSTVLDMISQGAVLDDRQADLVIAYLAKTYGTG